MIHTDIDIKDWVYNHIKSSSLVSILSGAVYKDQRPLNSTKEDIIISVLSRDAGAQVQSAIVNVNIYIPDISRDREYIENTARLRTVSTSAASLLEYWQDGTVKCQLQSQEIFKVNGIAYHAINNRLRITFNNES